MKVGSGLRSVLIRLMRLVQALALQAPIYGAVWDCHKRSSLLLANGWILLLVICVGGLTNRWLLLVADMCTSSIYYIVCYGRRFVVG